MFAWRGGGGGFERCRAGDRVTEIEVEAAEEVYRRRDFWPGVRGARNGGGLVEKRGEVSPQLSNVFGWPRRVIVQRGSACVASTSGYGKIVQRHNRRKMRDLKT